MAFLPRRLAGYGEASSWEVVVQPIDVDDRAAVQPKAPRVARRLVQPVGPRDLASISWHRCETIRYSSRVSIEPGGTCLARHFATPPKRRHRVKLDRMSSLGTRVGDETQKGAQPYGAFVPGCTTRSSPRTSPTSHRLFVEREAAADRASQIAAIALDALPPEELALGAFSERLRRFPAR